MEYMPLSSTPPKPYYSYNKGIYNMLVYKYNEKESKSQKTKDLTKKIIRDYLKCLCAHKVNNSDEMKKFFKDTKF